MNVDVLRECRFYGDVHDYLIENNVCDNDGIDDYINHMSRTEIIEAYLNWNGIYGYTDMIVALVASLLNPQYDDIYEVDFDDCDCNGNYIG